MSRYFWLFLVSSLIFFSYAVMPLHSRVFHLQSNPLAYVRFTATSKTTLTPSDLGLWGLAPPVSVEIKSYYTMHSSYNVTNPQKTGTLQNL